MKDIQIDREVELRRERAQGGGIERMVPSQLI